MTVHLPCLGPWGKEQGPWGRAGYWQIAGGKEDRGHSRKAVEATNGQPRVGGALVPETEHPGQGAAASGAGVRVALC